MSAPDTFAELYARHAEAVFACVVAILRNRDEAQDVVQEVFLQAWRQAGTYRPSRGSVASWLNCIARSRAIDRLRHTGRTAREACATVENTSVFSDSVHSVVRREQIERLRMAWTRLTPAHRRLLDLVYEEGMSHSAISALLQQPVGTVKTRIRQAVKILRHHVDDACVEKPARASSQDNRSAPFTITAEEKLVSLPLARTAQQHQIAYRLAGLRVLVVDDDAEVLRLTNAVLRRFGAISLTCPSSRTALEEINQSRLDVMIVDLAMPDEDGYSFLGRARAWAADHHTRIPPAAAFTASTSELERSRVLIAGFDAYLTKPVHPLALLSAIAALSQRDQQ